MKKFMNQNDFYLYTVSDKKFVYDPVTGSIFNDREINKILDGSGRDRLGYDVDGDGIRNHLFATEREWLEGKVLNKTAFSLAHNCNMKCAYCFANGGTYDEEAMMTIEMAEKCIEYFFRYAATKVNKYNVSYFGGEPLLNKKVFMYATESINRKAEERNIPVRYIVTTNGTIMDPDILNLIIDNNMHLNLSLDGGRETQNRNRRFVDGRPAFDKVMETLEQFRQKNYWNMTARITLTKEGVKTLKDDVLFLWKQGFAYVIIDIVRTDLKGIALDEASIDELKIQMDQILEILYTKAAGENKFLRNLTDIIAMIEGKKLKSECMYYNTNTIQFTPQGDIYKCSFTAGDKQQCIGNIFEGIKWDKFKGSFEPGKGCFKCWARRLCGGGCSLNRNNISCNFFRIMMSSSLKYYTRMKYCEII